VELDWFTILAQVVNFFVLVAILRSLLYRPILKVMEQRESDIAERTEAAEKARTESMRLAEAYAARNRDLENSARDLIEDAEARAESKHKEMLAAARDEVSVQRDRWLGALRSELHQSHTDICKRLAHQVSSATRRALQDLSGADLAAVSVERFFERWNNLDTDETLRVTAALREGKVSFVSSSKLEPERQDELRAKLSELAGRELTVEFEVDPELVLGVKLRAGGVELGWSVADYVSELESELLAAVPGDRTEDSSD